MQSINTDVQSQTSHNFNLIQFEIWNRSHELGWPTPCKESDCVQYFIISYLDHIWCWAVDNIAFYFCFVFALFFFYICLVFVFVIILTIFYAGTVDSTDSAQEKKSWFSWGLKLEILKLNQTSGWNRQKTNILKLLPFPHSLLADS